MLNAATHVGGPGYWESFPGASRLGEEADARNLCCPVGKPVLNGKRGQRFHLGEPDSNNHLLRPCYRGASHFFLLPLGSCLKSEASPLGSRALVPHFSPSQRIVRPLNLQQKLGTHFKLGSQAATWGVAARGMMDKKPEACGLACGNVFQILKDRLQQMTA